MINTENFGYRFSVCNEMNNKIIGSGFFKVSKKLNKKEQFDFLHEFTHKSYLNKYVSINIIESKN